MFNKLLSFFKTKSKAPFIDSKNISIQTESSNGVEYLMSVSDSITPKELALDIATLLKYINKNNYLTSKEVLFYIDDVNASLHISNFDSKSEISDNNHLVIICFNAILNENLLADDCNYILKKSIKNALKTSPGEMFTQLYEIYFVDTMGDFQKL